MKLIFKNKLYAYLSLSRIFNTTGASIYNLVFIVFASTMPLPKLAIALANFIVLVPTFVSIFIGIKADHTIQKARWLITMGYLQALLFVIVALLTNSSTYLAFGTVCLLNILSDLLSDFRSGLQLPIMQHNIPADDLMEAYSFNQVLSYLCSLGGQALGVWLLAISQQNFFLVALVNAAAFLLSSTTLFLVHKQLTHPPVTNPENPLPLKNQLKEIYNNAKVIFDQEGSSNFLNLLSQVLIINALFGSLSALYNLSLLEHPFGNLSFSQSILLVDVLIIGGIIFSSLFPHDYFAKQSINRLTFFVAVSLTLLGLGNALNLHFTLSFLALAFTGYITGKVNPMVNSMLMKKLKPEVLAQTSSFLSMLFMLSMPLGTIILTSLALWHLEMAWAVFTLGGIVCLLLTMKKD
ncbi:Dsg protein involved in extracellular polysaccharide synthesis and transport [Streptococcus sp. DD10]|uniref:MFS transporter n=1 Tax=Streptococcus sp. DD10 TaxID=1777878 RepID=UPI00079547D2|nr:MFS transporter [Streptococcus sp. DD10]KXT73791.1 Dsg protein involved in extracellular polysaccharide synthesis and transport [Streptococcus sp. DD10]